MSKHRSKAKIVWNGFVLLFLFCYFLSISSAFISPTHKSVLKNNYKKLSTSSSKTTSASKSIISLKNNNNDNNNRNDIGPVSPSVMTVTKDNDTRRAGTDGYSVTRQPLHESNWDPKVDPEYDTPDRLNDSDEAVMSSWWEDRNNKASTSKKTKQNIQQSKNSSKKQKDNDSSLSSSLTYSDDTTESLDLFQRSLDTLDFPRVLDALRQECFTAPGKKIVQEASKYITLKGQPTKMKKVEQLFPRAFQPLTSNTVESVQDRYEAVREMLFLLSEEHWNGVNAYYNNRRGYQVTIGNGNPPPLEGLSFDLDSIFQIIDDGQVLEGPEIFEVSNMLNAMEDLQSWSKGLQYVENMKFEQLPILIDNIQLNTTLQSLLENALDKDGKLSGETFPTLGRLRAKVRSLKTEILQTLDDLVSLPSIQSKLAMESGGALISEVSNGGRLVIPIDPKYASSIGIVHETSRSGKTVYVEPSEIVGSTNELRHAEGELQAEEARVWKSLTEQILQNRDDLEASVNTVGQLDLVLARALLGRTWDGILPQVKDEGVISLKNAKHPVLLLRQIENVVGSDIDLGANGNQGLVLTGPNSGGKTVILKLMGLMALMTRSGIPLPAASLTDEHEPRFDFFDPVLADIGDIQSVGGDLSTFSGHMLVCREVLANSGKNALVLMDELGSGTDPAQGVAIAQALLEAILETGSRVAITTHYMALKQLASSDSRFAVGGMEFIRGRPTYRLLPGTVGESFAMSVAERLGLPQTVLDRATELLDSETRQMGDLLRDLEDQKAAMNDQMDQVEAKKREVAQMEIQMKEEQIKLEQKMLNVRREEAKKFAKMLEEKERILEDVLEKLKSDPSRKIVAKSWDDIKFVKRDALTEAEHVPSVVAANQKKQKEVDRISSELVPLAEIRNRPNLNEGDRVIVCRKGAMFGQQATVVRDLGKRLEVQISGVPTTLKAGELALPPASGVLPDHPKSNEIVDPRAKSSKFAEKALREERSTPGQKSTEQTTSVEKSNKSKGLMFKTDANTIDIRGKSFEEAKDKVLGKFSSCLLSGQSVVYILHGHGSGGVLKTKLRGWLRTERKLVTRWRPADQIDGGDAYTVVELR